MIRTRLSYKIPSVFPLTTVYSSARYHSIFTDATRLTQAGSNLSPAHNFNPIYNEEKLRKIKSLFDHYPFTNQFYNVCHLHIAEQRNILFNEVCDLLRPSNASDEMITFLISKLVIEYASKKDQKALVEIVSAISRQFNKPLDELFVTTLESLGKLGIFPNETLIDEIQDPNKVIEFFKIFGKTLPTYAVGSVLRYSKLNARQKLEILSTIGSPHLKNFAERCKNQILTSHNPEIQAEQIDWLVEIIKQSDRYPHFQAILQNSAFTNLLDEICTIKRSSLRNAVTEKILSLSDSSIQILSQQLPNLAPHQLLPALLLSQLNLSLSSFTQCISSLQPKIYKNGLLLFPLLETIYHVTASSLSSQEKEKILQILLIAPQKKKGQSDQVHKIELESFRKNQKLLIPIISYLVTSDEKSLIDFNGSFDIIFQRYKQALNTLLATPLTEQEAERCLELFFYSSRLPGGLLTYASKLHLIKERSACLSLLGQLVRSLLDEKFPTMRYETTHNPHLQTIDPALLELWKHPVSLSIFPQESETQIESPQQMTARLIRQAIQDKHLGDDQNTQYPALSQLSSNEPNSQSTEQSTLSQQIEKRCLQLLNSEHSQNTLQTQLKELHAIVPKELEFKRDLEGILRLIQRGKQPARTWKVTDSDAIDDLLLSGTEVANSCQHIQGNPQLNKCLLSTICDGKIKVMVVKDPSGKILARSTLRILIDQQTQKAVLHMDRVYSSINDASLHQALLQGGILKAKQMGVPLITAFSENHPQSQRTLISLKGVAPFEYVDHAGGIYTDGYTIHRGYEISIS